MLISNNKIGIARRREKEAGNIHKKISVRQGG
jgi:hypothetical protein